MKKFNILLVAASLLVSVNLAHATASPKLYSLKGEAQAGTRIASVDATSTVPFSKRFDALTSEQQNLVRAKFDNLGANDTPPFPVAGLRAVYKPLIKANKVYGSNNALSVTATVDSSGDVSDVTVHDNSNEKLAAYIERRLKYTKFEPATCNGVACDMNFPIEISFN